MLQHVRQTVEVDINEGDLITPQEAANLSGRSLSTIVSLMALDRLPIYSFPHDTGKRIKKWTSRREILAMPKEKGQRKSAKKPPARRK